ncbi:MAG: 4Fe-4S cluster-binding domain-containing protein [Candidatus Brockarchaeota archaeon]|nr:4Fe-4S cluster-binding domain-containing protein [Candidatus Brockarchaeota archaeon]
MWALRPSALTVWRNKEVRKRLDWYYGVMTDAKPAKFLICKKLPADFSQRSDEAELWEEHERLVPEFAKLHASVSKGEAGLGDLPAPEKSFLDLKAEILRRILRSCHLCERRCGADRAGGEKGHCKLDHQARVSTWFHHFGEEPPIVGGGGSGTIFFTSCTFSCAACQNHDISTDPDNGAVVDGRRLASIMRSLRAQGASNINVVGGEPTMHSATIVEALKHLDVNVPFLWNSNMYCSLELMKILSEIVDIWLPDFKYGNDGCAQRLSSVKNYFSVVSRNHGIAGKNGDMIIRHLVLPGHLECCTKPVLDWIARNLGERALVNVMEQYRPEHLVARHPEKYPDIARRLTRGEIERAYGYARELGLVFEPVS